MQLTSGKLDRFGRFSRAALFAASVLPVTFAALPANAADYLQSAPAVVDNTVCNQQSVLRSVVSRFGYQVRHVPELPQVGISAMSDVQLTRYEPKTNPAEIERTYCKATAVLSDGQYRSVWYLVEEGQGFASVGRNVEFCVEGFDRWYVYDAPSCRVLR
ncbi:MULTISPECIES: phage portal protein [Brucella]|uniref:Phage portal protein n=1 Tax=Ochrobactrum teleogrylli TaxID=2479765 RepID=A0ABY2Y739_9HYPH|nr:MULTISPECIES: phage portal protein [Brucella]MDX4072565.1 phage portal protein [Brucella sp. NBRC 113783]TNV16225.1 phage portal protein [[Ochrobactrum] teleogrylli]